MSDTVSASKTARESLARALGALQSDQSVPGGLMAVADPVSQAMGALFRIERSAGANIAQDGSTALEAVRRALALLQQQPTNHPAVQVAMEAVAGSLSLVHGLATQQAAFPQSPQQAAHQPPPQQAAHQPPPQQAAHQPPPQQAAYQQTALAQQPAFGTQPVQQAPAQYAPQKVDVYQPTMAIDPAPSAPAATSQARQVPVSAGSGPRIEAELGAQSPSNFYKGLSGSDVVDHGGLFVATFNVPRIGQPVNLHVSLPGGYEFDALAVVRWTREPLDAGESGVQPGFGAQFTQISPEARQLVYRYVRNREPLFHDDL